MKIFKSLPMLPLAVIGAMAATPVMATSLLDADLASFTVLGASTVTNIPNSSVAGNVGVWSSGGANAITGFASSIGNSVSDVQVSGGTVQAGTIAGVSNTMQAQLQLTAAINNLSSLGGGTLEPADLGGLTLKPGVYTVPAGTTNLSSTLILDGQGNANAAWVFELPSTLITSPFSSVQIINTGSGAGVFWNVGSSATIDNNTSFLGNILAHTSITMNTAATDLSGRVLASTGAVTLNQNILSGNGGGLSGGLDVSSLNGVNTVNFLAYAPVGSVPEASTYLLLLLSAAAIWLKIGKPRKASGDFTRLPVSNSLAAI